MREITTDFVGLGGLKDPIHPMTPTINVQGFLEWMGSGLAKTSIGGTIFGIGSKPISKVIEATAKKYNMRPEWILTVLEAEQNLVSDKRVYDPSYTIINRKETGDERPTPLKGGHVIRNGSEKYVTAAPYAKWVEFVGDWKLGAAVGAGIPDPSGVAAIPSWDVRKFLGFENQIDAIGMFTRRDWEKWNSGAEADRVVTMDSGEKVLCGDFETFAMLRWTSKPQVLTERPIIFSWVRRKYDQFIGVA